MSKFSRVRFHLFVAWNIHAVVSSNICFLLIIVLLIHLFGFFFLVAVISIYLLFFMESSSRRCNVSTLSPMLAIPLPPSFLDTYSLSLSSLIYNALWNLIRSITSTVTNKLKLLKISYSSIEMHLANSLALNDLLIFNSFKLYVRKWF